MIKKIKNISLFSIMILLVATFISGCSNKDSKEKNITISKTDNYKIKVGYYNCDHMVSAPIADAAGIYKELGIDAEVIGNAKVPQAMLAGQMDVGYIGIDNVIKSVDNKVPMIIGADNHIGGSYYLVVSNDIKDPKDLIGQPLGIGSNPEKSSGWVEFARELGIPVEGKNYEAIDFASDKDAYLAFKTGKIKGFIACDPWGSMAEYEKTGKILITSSKLEGQWGDCCVLSINKDFAEKHPELAKKVALAHTKAMEFVYLNPLKTAKIFAKTYMVPEEVGLLTVYKKTVKEGRTLSWKIVPEQIKHELSWKQENGYVPNTVTYEELVDSKFIDESGADDFDKFIKEKVDPVFPVGMSYDEWKTKAKKLGK
ncbi:ABC-type nitrate/sulfonate/bicarbonate transport system, periplasmic component [Gottschalkia purinilytica]|uniref:ABC-type nitrate/sulfonate/bicarbonate transport system, periplasmic component n=1 Tax=Gottschalkia purinilytica TaxID=1503 RepID=A0A0L0WAB1_GOTPU|nr:ABC transporter substrate-binding subunit SaoX [Gottschalkia purinilytica]KNF08387.1 ABC-type nitrate/sulfonate/bicarbonate transport system, periplasmic component [Gottschalkia purinilytica]